MGGRGADARRRPRCSVRSRSPRAGTPDVASERRPDGDQRSPPSRPADAHSSPRGSPQRCARSCWARRTCCGSAMLLIALPVITALVANRSRYLLSCSREVTPTRVQAGQSATVSLRLQNPGRVPTGLMLLEDQVPYVLGSRPRFVLDQLRPRWHRSMAYTVRSEVRGRYSIGPLTVRLTDPFGFVELTRVVHRAAHPSSSPRSWTSCPRSGCRATGRAPATTGPARSPRPAPRTSRSASTGMGDDLRRVHWRSTARAGELMVRREEQPYQSRATVMLDTRDDGAPRLGAGVVVRVRRLGCRVDRRTPGRQGFTLRMLTDEAGVETRPGTTAARARGRGAAAARLARRDLDVLPQPHRRRVRRTQRVRPRRRGAR